MNLSLKIGFRPYNPVAQRHLKTLELKLEFQFGQNYQNSRYAKHHL